MAKEILGDGWEIIPHGMSRYYSTDPALADNFIRATDSIREVLRRPQTRLYQRAISLGGRLVFNLAPFIDLYSEKVYGEPHPYIASMLPQMSEICEIPCNQLYKDLINRNHYKIKDSNLKYGEIQRIHDGTIYTSTGQFSYDRILSTVPLNFLLKAAGQDWPLKARDVWIYHIESDQIDLEGADEVLVADKEFAFYKCVRVGRHSYVFHCLDEVRTPEQYFGLFTNNRLSVLNSTKIAEAIPLSDGPPDLKELEERGIECIGSNAQWDDMVDASTCLFRILKMRAS